MCKEVGAPTPEPNDPGWGPLAAQVTLQGSEVVVAHQRAKPCPPLAQDSCYQSPGASQFLPKFAAEGPRLNSSGASPEARQNPKPKPKQEGPRTRSSPGCRRQAPGKKVLRNPGMGRPAHPSRAG